MKINWAQKLSSRKLWVLLGALITCCGALFGLDSHFITDIVAVVSAVGAVIIYILTEGKVDAARIEADADIAAAQIHAGQIMDIDDLATQLQEVFSDVDLAVKDRTE